MQVLNGTYISSPFELISLNRTMIGLKAQEAQSVYAEIQV
jgi:hypothetical protein